MRRDRKFDRRARRRTRMEGAMIRNFDRRARRRTRMAGAIDRNFGRRARRRTKSAGEQVCPGPSARVEVNDEMRSWQRVKARRGRGMLRRQDSGS